MATLPSAKLCIWIHFWQAGAASPPVPARGPELLPTQVEANATLVAGLVVLDIDPAGHEAMISWQTPHT